jgi:hypothetical protein
MNQKDSKLFINSSISADGLARKASRKARKGISVFYIDDFSVDVRF